MCGFGLYMMLMSHGNSVLSRKMGTYNGHAMWTKSAVVENRYIYGGVM